MKRTFPSCRGRRGATRRVAVLVAVLGVSAVGATPPVWELQMDGRLVRLVGSVHYLREDDYPLPGIIRRVYAEADTLVVEYDTKNLGRPVDPRVLTRRVPRAGRVKPTGELRRFLDMYEFSELRRLARQRGYDVERLDDIRPWFAGMYVIDRELEKAGFRSDLGLDSRLLERARKDGKPVISLENRSDRRRIFEEIPMSDQVGFLIDSLRDAPRLGEVMAGVVTSWREGDLERLLSCLVGNLKRRPGEYRRFAVERNRQWLDRLVDLPDEGDSYLVVVGTIHLLGDDSLIALLRERGIEVRRME